LTALAYPAIKKQKKKFPALVSNGFVWLFLVSFSLLWLFDPLSMVSFGFS